MGAQTIAAVAAVIGAGTAVYSAATADRSKPKQLQAARAPDQDVYKKKAAGIVAPGGASPGIGNILGPSNSTGSNTLLGQ